MDKKVQGYPVQYGGSQRAQIRKLPAVGADPEDHVDSIGSKLSDNSSLGTGRWETANSTIHRLFATIPVGREKVLLAQSLEPDPKGLEKNTDHRHTWLSYNIFDPLCQVCAKASCR
jgi:hypothetical protein